MTAAPVLYLIAALIGALFAVNAYRPILRRGRLSVVAFFAGWLTSELPAHHVVWQLVATVVFARFGALEAWPGQVGLACTLLSWVALAYLTFTAGRAADVVEGALRDGLGPDYRDRIEAKLADDLARPLPIRQLFLPFAVRHPQVRRIADLKYGEHGRRNQLDVYRRRDEPTGCPVLIEVHGGAWMIGDKEQQGQPLIHHMASLGWVCVSINYRLSPRSTFPDHIVDVKRAVAWVKAHIAEYGGDPDFIAITGGSAGGHLCSLAALTGPERSFQPGFEDADTSVQACVPFYGVYDFTNREGIGNPATVRLLERFVLKQRFDEHREAFDEASPMSWVNEQAPPFFVIHGVNDSLVPAAEARHFVDLLRRASQAPVAYAELPRAQHAFEVFASVRTRQVIRAVARFLAYVYSEHRRTALEPHPVPAPLDETERAAAS